MKPAPGKRRCNCRNEVYHKQIGPGMFQQMTEQVMHLSSISVGDIFMPFYLLYKGLNPMSHSSFVLIHPRNCSILYILLALSNILTTFIQVCEQCPNVKYEREGYFITVDIEKGMQDGQVSFIPSILNCNVQPPAWVAILLFELFHLFVITKIALKTMF